MAYTSISFITTTGASTFAVPANFNPNDNLVEVIGSGGGGSARQSSSVGGTGGGGGAYASSTNVQLPGGKNVDVQIGAAGGTTLTWIKNAVGGTIQVQADFGVTGTTSTAGLGGLVANCTGTTKVKGGNGFKPGAGVAAGGGGGGAAGNAGAGGDSSSSTGGNSNNGALAGQGINTAGLNGTEWDATHGSGSGAGGGSGSGNKNGSAGGRYGAAGSGCNTGAGASGGAGFQGVIVLQWNPATVKFDASATSAYQASLSTYNFNITVGSNNGRVLLVGVAIFATGTVSTITAGGTSMSFVRSDVNGVYRSEIWSLFNPGTGSITITVTLSASLTSIANACSYYNASTVALDGNTGANGTNTPSSASRTTIADRCVVFGNLCAQSASGILTAGTQTSRTISAGALGTGASDDSGGDIKPAGSKTITWTGEGALDSWAIGLVSIQPLDSLDWCGVYPKEHQSITKNIGY